jgi:hypothetical protein
MLEAVRSTGTAREDAYDVQVITPWSIVLQKLIVGQLIKKLPAFYVT